MKLLYYFCVQHTQLLTKWRNSLPLTAIKALKQMPYQWLYNPIIKITAIQYVIEILGNVIQMTSHMYNHCHSLLLYKLADYKQWTSGLVRFLECRTCNILVVTQALVLCLIYMHLPLGVVRIYQAKHSYLCHNLYLCDRRWQNNTSSPVIITRSHMLALTHWVKFNRPYCFLGDKRTGGKEYSWVGQGNSEVEIKFDSLTFEEDNLWSTEKLDLTATKQSKTLTVPRQSYKYTPKSASCSDEETLTLSESDSTLSVPKVWEFQLECLVPLVIVHM